MPDTGLNNTLGIAFDRTRTPDTGSDNTPGVALDKTRKPDTGQVMTSFTTVVENSDQ